ncbi:hypothetical protein OG780_42595 [Streptomyces sp. NBC_00386]|uniref:hypothetical protein n=1 Tax=Streptomyces sp. NBC_00386 TaxID=2975734 RepID=UPI002E1AA5B1
MNRQADPAHHDPALALTLAVLLLTGSVLLTSCLIGPVTTFAAVAVLVVTAYAAPGIARRLALRPRPPPTPAHPARRLTCRADLKEVGGGNVPLRAVGQDRKPD